MAGIHAGVAEVYAVMSSRRALRRDLHVDRSRDAIASRPGGISRRRRPDRATALARRVGRPRRGPARERRRTAVAYVLIEREGQPQCRRRPGIERGTDTINPFG
jgi:hypothetical protein